jgi:ADP-ribose pyrophosphatase
MMRKTGRRGVWRAGERAPTLVDLPAAAQVSAPRTIGRGYRSYDRHEIALADGSFTSHIDRDVLRSGSVVGILPIDLDTAEVVLIRQFRLGGHIALGKGDMIELPAGRVGLDETTEQAARRECYEEIGVLPRWLHPLFAVMPAPALSDECMTLYIASIDASQVKHRSGCAHEDENIETLRLSIDSAKAMLARGGFHNSLVIIALQWLALNSSALPAIFQGTPGVTVPGDAGGSRR